MLALLKKGDEDGGESNDLDDDDGDGSEEEEENEDGVLKVMFDVTAEEGE